MCWTKHSDPVTAADEEALTGDPPRLLGGQEHHHIGHVVWPPHAPKRDVVDDRLFRFGGDPPRLDRSWGDHVDRDAKLTKFHSGRATVGFQRRFARPVGHLAWKTVSPVRADIDDPAPRCTANGVPARVLRHEEGHRPAVYREVPIVATRVDHDAHATRPVLLGGS